MKSKVFGLLFLCLICGAAGVLVLHHAATKEALKPATPDASNPQVVATYGKLPLAFEINKGQTDSQVKFLSRGSGYTLFLTSDEAVLALQKPSAISRQRSALRNSKFTAPNSTQGKDWRTWPMDFKLLSIDNLQSSFSDSPAPNPQLLAPSTLRLKLLGANSSAKVEGTDQLPGKSNYFIGNDPKKWRTNVSNYAKVHYKDVYPGVDLVYYGNQGKLEHDFVVSPGADPAAIKLAIEGADSLRLDKQGNLVAQVTSGEMVLNRPNVYQPGNPKSVDGRFALLADNLIGFEVAAYDRTQPLVIDPVLVYSSFLGGRGDDYYPAIAVDSRGNAYVAGFTNSTDFPTTSGAFQRSFGGGGSQCDYPEAPCGDAFVTKINASGTAIVYSTYLGGSDSDIATAIALDSYGNAYVTGHTHSADFPVTRGAFQPAYAGNTAPCNQYFYCGDAFVTKINSSGSGLAYSTYLGGSENEYGAGIAVDSAGSAYITGSTDSADFPTTAASFQPTFGYGDCGIGPAGRERLCPEGFVTKLSPSGTGLIYSTYLGGSMGENESYAIAIDAAGSAYIAGATDSAGFPVTHNAFQTQLHSGPCPWGEPCYDAFLTKLNAAGTAPLYSTFFGGSGYDIGEGIALDPYGNVYLAGVTPSADFPVTPGAFQTTFGGGICDTWYGTYCSDIFVAKFNPSKTGPASLVYSTYLGGDGEDFMRTPTIIVDRWGDAHIGGYTMSTNFPVVNPLQATNFNAPDWPDAFLTKLNASGSAAIYSTYLGGDSWDNITGLALDPAGNAHIAGETNSWVDNPFPITSHAFQNNICCGGLDVFVAKISPANAPSAVLYPRELQFGDVYVNTPSPPQVVNLRNVGSGRLVFAAVIEDRMEEFYQRNDCDHLVPGAGSCTITVYFRPRAVGGAEGYLTIFDNAQQPVQTIPLHGRGVQ